MGLSNTMIERDELSGLRLEDLGTILEIKLWSLVVFLGLIGIILSSLFVFEGEASEIISSSFRSNYACFRISGFKFSFSEQWRRFSSKNFLCSQRISSEMRIFPQKDAESLFFIIPSLFSSQVLKTQEK